MGVRKPAEWMQASDDRILEFLDTHGTNTPKGIAESDEIDLSKGTISNRVRVLNKAGLIERVQRGVYKVSEKGIGYLNGQEDCRDEPEPK